MFVICYNFSKRNAITTHGRENLNFENDDTTTYQDGLIFWRVWCEKKSDQVDFDDAVYF